MHTAQAGIVFQGSADPDVRNAASVWEGFRDSMRELATDQVAAAIATGAFDEVDASHSGKIQGLCHSNINNVSYWYAQAVGPDSKLQLLLLIAARVTLPEVSSTASCTHATCLVVQLSALTESCQWLPVSMLVPARSTVSA